MPSGSKLAVNTNDLVSTPYSHLKSSVPKKASNVLLNFKKQKVRGVAKNAVDHPNGGKGRSGLRSKKSPWGWSL